MSKTVDMIMGFTFFACLFLMIFYSFCMSMSDKYKWNVFVFISNAATGCAWVYMTMWLTIACKIWGFLGVIVCVIIAYMMINAKNIPLFKSSFFTFGFFVNAIYIWISVLVM